MKAGEFDSPWPTAGDVKARAGELAFAAKAVWEMWEQDGEGMDPVLGTGGICQDVASAMVEALGRMGVEHAMSLHASVGENHVFVVALLGDGVYAIDIPPGVYEIGSGYVWRKRTDAVFDETCVSFEKVANRMSPAEFEDSFA